MFTKATRKFSAFSALGFAENSAASSTARMAGDRVLLDTSLLVAASVEEHPIHAGFFGKRLDADLQLTLALTRLGEIVGEGV